MKSDFADFIKGGRPKFDGFVKSRKMPFSVIPAKAEIQSFQWLPDSRLRGSDDWGTFYHENPLCRGGIYSRPFAGGHKALPYIIFMGGGDPRKGHEGLRGRQI